MSAVMVLLELRAQGITIDVVDGRIRCLHKPDALTPQLADRVRACRAEVVALLTDPDALREAAARAIFDADPVDRGGERLAETDASVSVQCSACGLSRDAAVTVCPRCQPTARDSVGQGGCDYGRTVPGTAR